MLAPKTYGLTVRINHWIIAVAMIGMVGFGLRLGCSFPPAASPMPAWQETASKAVHWALLAGVIVMPASGIIASVFQRRAIDVFGLFDIPAQAENASLAGLVGLTRMLTGRTATTRETR
jgi:cytochrome b561